MIEISNFKLLQECYLYEIYKWSLQESDRTTFHMSDAHEVSEGLASPIFSQKAALALIQRSLLDIDNLHCSISIQGIEYVEQQLRQYSSAIYQYAHQGEGWYLENRKIGVDEGSWKSGDEGGQLEENAKQQIITLLEKCLSEIEKANFSNTDQSQINSQLSAAKNLAAAPQPKLGWVKRLLSPLAQISEISGLIKKILELLG